MSIFLPLFFILGLDLTIDLIHVIAQQIKNPSLHRCLEKSVANWKELCNFMLDIFQISRQPRQIRKNRNHQKFLLMQGYLSKVNLWFSYFAFKQLAVLHNELWKLKQLKQKNYAFDITILTLFSVNVLPIQGVRSRSGPGYRQ